MFASSKYIHTRDASKEPHIFFYTIILQKRRLETNTRGGWVGGGVRGDWEAGELREETDKEIHKRNTNEIDKGEQGLPLIVTK